MDKRPQHWLLQGDLPAPKCALPAVWFADSGIHGRDERIVSIKDGGCIFSQPIPDEVAEAMREWQKLVGRGSVGENAIAVLLGLMLRYSEYTPFEVLPNGRE